METEIAQSVAERIERCFGEIEKERMKGIPILNAALSVRVIGMREWGEDWLCVLLTPWFMNVMLLARASEKQPDAEEKTPAPIRAGVKRNFPFPAGRFEFIRGEEPAIGPYWMCSLFSPVLQFADQETAEAAAQAALDAILGEAEATTEEERDMAMIWKGDLPKPDDANISTDAEKDGRPEPNRAEATERPSREEVELSRRTFLGGRTPGARP